jgi:hypothetical protein
MKNLKIEEIAKLEHCECESPCGACLEKYAHVFEKDEENIASVSATNITGDAIANYVLTHTNAIYDYGTQFIQPKHKSDGEIIQDLIKDVEKLKEQVSIILMTIK